MSQKFHDLYRRIERLDAFIDILQGALGWQVEVEKVSDEREYNVKLKFTLTFKGKAWPDIVRNRSFQLIVLEMVKNRLQDLWDDERELLQTRTEEAHRTK